MTSSLARSRLYRSSGHWRNKSKQGSCTVLGVGAAKAACPIRNVGGWPQRDNGTIKAAKFKVVKSIFC